MIEEKEGTTHWAETNPLCQKCVHDCKQSNKVEIIVCPEFRRKDGKEKKKKED